MESDRSILKHSNEAAFQTSLPTGYNKRGQRRSEGRGHVTGIQRSRLFIYLVLNFSTFLYPEVQLG